MQESPHNTRHKEILRKYLPEVSLDYVLNLFYKFPVVFKIVNARKTKLGDFRPNLKKGQSIITVNGDLNQYSFLITTIHEFAHLNTFQKHGWKVAPHGEEWKREFRELLLPVLNERMVPKDLEIALVNSMMKTKASSCTDLVLTRALMKYDQNHQVLKTVESLEKDAVFSLNGKTFRKGTLRRSRYLCEEIGTNKKYHVHCLAIVD